MRLSLLFACFAIWLPATADSQSVVGSSADESPLHALLHEPFEQPLGYSLVLGDAKNRVLARFGPPQSQESTRYPSRTSDELLWSTVFSYEGLTVSLGESEDRSWSWLESVEITTDEYPLRFGVHVGATRDDILDVLTDATVAETDNTLSFSAQIWESRNDTKHRPGEPVTVESAMVLTIDLDDHGRVSRILIESIEL